MSRIRRIATHDVNKQKGNLQFGYLLKKGVLVCLVVSNICRIVDAKSTRPVNDWPAGRPAILHAAFVRKLEKVKRLLHYNQLEKWEQKFGLDIIG